jgi:hypothetical protein
MEFFFFSFLFISSSAFRIVQKYKSSYGISIHTPYNLNYWICLIGLDQAFRRMPKSHWFMYSELNLATSTAPNYRTAMVIFTDKQILPPEGGWAGQYFGISK